ncbi:trypsin-like peptidase domain-containing protein [Sphingomonas sp. UYP23]
MPLSNLFARPALAAILLAGGAGVGATGALALTEAATPTRGVVAPAVAPLRDGQPHGLADMVAAVGPSVVQIKVMKHAEMQQMAYGGEGDDQDGLGEQLRRFFGPQFAPGGRGGAQQAPLQGALGSGFIIDKSGIVLTNNHVVDGATQVKVQLSDGKEYDGRVLGKDPKTDVAVVKIEGRGDFRPIEWGDSDRIRVGDSVFAVGSPFGLGNTVTAGIVSARSRDIGNGPYDDYLQVDAAINSGNSGGPLFDGYGRVVGMNTAIFSPSGGNVGIGFAIPEMMARRVADQIVAHGSVARGHIGVTLQNVTPDIADTMQMKGTDGALVADVGIDSPAALSGIKQGDVVRSFDGRSVKDTRAFSRMVADARVGARVPITVVRDGRQVALDLRIGGEHNS